MPNYQIKEVFTNGASQNTYISATDESTALGVAQAFYGGNHQAFEESASVTTEEAAITPVSFKRARIMLKNEATDDTTFLNLIVKDTVSDLDIEAALKNKTINGVHADKVTILSIVKTVV